MIPFYKVSGSGNDFIALVEPKTVPSSDTIRHWCRRRISVGADGVFTLNPEQHEAGSDTAEVRLVYFNSDGELADLCLNATRCAAQLSFYLGWSTRHVIVHTAAGSLRSEILDQSRVVVEAPVAAAPATERTVETARGSFSGWSITVGVPHFVQIVDQPLDDIEIAAIAPPIRSHPLFGNAGTNVDFVRFPAPHRMEIRSFERGIEDETLACGTGILAAAAVGVAQSKARLPLEVRTLAAFEHQVDGEIEGSTIVRWTLTGDARVVLKGTMFPGSEIPELAC
jgi:diaminopimelate epimerase